MSSEEAHVEGSGGEEDEGEIIDWQLPLCFTKKRHRERIEKSQHYPQTWRMKERMKTVSVALALCLNIGIDPPDVVKTSPCARMECWMDPTDISPQKALDEIGSRLQKQYEKWQPRARYKLTLDPTVDDIKKLCTNLRRNAKEERVLFHYNGHGVPRPTPNGEIWVFNKSYTQYIPLSVYDLQTWMGSPSIFVYDCSNAGIILENFNQFSKQREKEFERCNTQENGSALSTLKDCIQIAACQPDELLPMQPDVPADVFTACLTTPIKIALNWFCQQSSVKLVEGIDKDLIEKIPGRLNDRRTPLGELNWIFTAVTDTIAWNVLPRDLFQKLFRQDLLVASLFRNFLLAERIMRSYNCTPMSCPKIPPTHQHPMWLAWDLAVDTCMSQIDGVVNQGKTFQNSLFFSQQLTAFQVWLAMGRKERTPPEQLPIVLQVLLSQVHRLRALDLLGRFLDLGPWAVHLALSVGISPYVLKLLQSSSRELRPLLVFIWAKILAVDDTCQADLVKDNGHRYFVSVLADPYMPPEHRTMAAFVLTTIVKNYPEGQEACLQNNLIAVCLEQLNDPHPLLRQWLALCLGRTWMKYSRAKWCGVRDSAHEKLLTLANDPLPEVRAAAVFALGQFVGNTAESTDLGNQVDFSVGMNLISLAYDGSPIVREEVVRALYGLVSQFESNFGVVAIQFLEEEDRLRDTQPQPATTSGGWVVLTQGVIVPPSFSLLLNQQVAKSKRIKSRGSSPNLMSYGTQGVGASQHMSTSPNLSSSGGSSGSESVQHGGLRRSSSHAPFNSPQANVYSFIWRILLILSCDPSPSVASLAKKIVNMITLKASVNRIPRHGSSSVAESCPSSLYTISRSDSSRLSSELSNVAEAKASEKPSHKPSASGLNFYPHSYAFSAKRRMFVKGPDLPENEEPSDESEDDNSNVPEDFVDTKFCDWCCSYFAQSMTRPPDEHDPYSEAHLERENRFTRNARVRSEAMKQLKDFTRLDDQMFINRNSSPPVVLRFNPYEPHIAVADRLGVNVWNFETGTKLSHFENGNRKSTKITAMELLNSHDLPLLLTGSNDGGVRVWRNYTQNNPELVTAWQGLTNLVPSTRGNGAGMVVNWEQQTGWLMASGDVRHIHVWDTQREMKLQDIPTGAESCVTSIVSDYIGRSLLVIGCGDGSVRLFDRRLPPSDSRVMTMREHQSWIVNVVLQNKSSDNIISASVDGHVKFWDPRFSESVRNLESVVSHMTSFEVHSAASVIACGSYNQSVRVTKIKEKETECMSTIRHHDGFMGQRIGPVNTMSFHPHKVHLAVGCADSIISIYSTEKKR
ncbi:regulatory-associated protein of mTOR-like isoform X4 [Xenia sp. Carnegie-2017]|uniref:regulatory-associated protein of mTOR-like isoform X3 n=1 Tax=Xenia sp. Carnegie-2017 TaxID=2897299 RepID=UPI001F038A88|nr:regulatory-associated protein of mTOR-like isoform X3 [Xenia sp. Carnegie-2017]XP_046854751.1 regulatory-associated protein of mTOR-like isoform X4 [Xenia sp. Carnegie-2017]